MSMVCECREPDPHPGALGGNTCWKCSLPWEPKYGSKPRPAPKDQDHAYTCKGCGCHSVDIDRMVAWCSACHAMVADERPDRHRHIPIYYREKGDWSKTP